MGKFKYKAFISYSHKDEQWGRWLHRKLETYPIPKYLIGKKTNAGIIPRRLKPIFRDREELAAADNLGDKIQQALASSKALIIICSPHAAKSHWVNQEVLAFKRKYRGAQIFSLIVDGEPNASLIKGREEQECFPAALRFELDAQGSLTDIPAEPLAADIRSHADGKRLGALKLISGLIGTGLDEIVQRDMRRGRRRVTAITAGALVAMLSMGTLTGFALDARKEAEARRNDAEGLVDFMLGDLRDSLEPIGRLDALNGVALKALDYYHDQDEAQLSCDATSRKARAHYVNARILIEKTQYMSAEVSARYARDLMRKKATECHHSIKYAINYAHAEQWVVTPAWKRAIIAKNHTDAEPLFRQALEGFKKSKAILLPISENSDHMFEIDIEMADVELLIGKSLMQLGEHDKADKHFLIGLALIDRHYSDYTKLNDTEKEIAHRALDKKADILSWRADIAERSGNYDKALEIINLYKPIYEQLSRLKENRDWEAYRAALGADYSQARIRVKTNQLDLSLQLLERLSIKALKLVNHDPENKEWDGFQQKIIKSKEWVASTITTQKEKQLLIE